MIGSDEVKEIVGLIETARDDWLHKTKASMRTTVQEKLDAHLHEIISKLLGFDNRWGGSWEIDHCNGRKSSIADEIVAEVQPAVHDHVLAALKNWKPSAAQKKAIVTDYEHEFKRKVREAVAERARVDVQTFVQNLTFSESYEADFKDMLDSLTKEGATT